MAGWKAWAGAMVRDADAVWRRTVLRRSPFPAGAEVPLLVHCSHHKAGTVWFQQILRGVARSYGLRFEIGEDQQDRPSARTRVFVQQHSRLATDELGDLRGSHVVRDPRDTVVSAYLYHRWTRERWVHEPRADLDGRSYQEELLRLDQDDGLALEIERLRPLFRRLAAWDYADPRFLELRFEDVRRDERGAFERVFRHYGFTDEAVATGLGFVDHFSWERTKQREQEAGLDGPSHLRSRESGEWQAMLTPAHLARLDEACGDLRRRLGYV